MIRAVGRILRRAVRARNASTPLSDEQRTKLIAGIEEAKTKVTPPTIVLIGESGVGKSSTINALFNAGQPVSAIEATTRVAVGLDISLADLTEKTVVSGTGRRLRVIDMPGLGDDQTRYRSYIELYLEVLPQADVILWVHPAPDRSVQFVQSALHELFVKSLPMLTDRLVFGLNKADTIYPGDWSSHTNLPSAEQIGNLEGREVDFTEKMRAALPNWNKQAIAYSALRRYRLAALFKELLIAMPVERRWVLTERMDIADFTELVDQKLLRAAQARAIMNSTEDPGTTNSASVRPGRDTIDPERMELLTELSDERYRELAADRNRLLEFLRPRGRNV